MERNLLRGGVFVFRKLSVTTLMVIGIRVVHLFVVLIEDLVLNEVDSLLDEVYISKMLEMENEFNYSS